ncbi:type III CRISPR-associated RAMP protein Csx7 [Caloranaerobacter sp. DY30410]|uniref:type III CRISPR-associated RAMP protein Csx7 n=1 Tax=Caloranaerobacter sp. DY30410 TaxID=3238305 RepID=UPI003CFCE667
MFFDKFDNRYIIKGSIKALTPIHIGTGENSFDPLQVDSTVIRDENGKPYIPGSSLKGVLRSYIEVLLKSGIDSKYKACLIVNEPCISDKFMKEIKEDINKNEDIDNKDYEIAKRIYDKMCDVCKVFGSSYFASKLKIRDCKLKQDMAYVERRDGICIDRETGTALDGRKYEFEQVAAGTEFEFYMSVDNLDDEHEELLKYIINILKSGELKVGGKTSIGLGNIKLVDFEVYKITKNTLKDYITDGLNEKMRWDYV